MNSKQLSQIQDLIREGGEGRYIVFDGNNPAFVVMSLNEYRNLTQGNGKIINKTTESSLVEKINRIIAEWRVSQQELDQQNEFGSLKGDRINEESQSEYSKNNNGLSYYYDIDKK